MGLAEIIVMIAFVLFFVGVALSFFFGIAIIQLEHVFSGIFNRPFYVHLYVSPKFLDEKQQFLLRQHSGFYLKLTPKRKRYFEHRMVKFLERYEFVGRQDFVITDEVRIRVASTFVMMTFGMRKYLVTVFDKIILYPDVYESVSTGEMHKGEFNPAYKAVVFSWADFVSGHSDSDDNINLGIHEFSHVLHYHGQKSPDVSAKIFLASFTQMMKEISHPNNKKALVEAGYFREYAYENAFEFLAVVIEHYFETPDEFQRRFPQLYNNVSRMLNHKH